MFQAIKRFLKELNDTLETLVVFIVNFGLPLYLLWLLVSPFAPEGTTLAFVVGVAMWVKKHGTWQFTAAVGGGVLYLVSWQVYGLTGDKTASILLAYSGITFFAPAMLKMLEDFTRAVFVPTTTH